MSVEMHGYDTDAAEAFANEWGIEWEYMETWILEATYLFNDDASDACTLMLTNGCDTDYRVIWTDEDEQQTILDVSFDTIEAAVRAYKAIMQGYKR